MTYFIRGLVHCLHLYIKECHICQLLHKDKPPTRQLQTRINLNYRSLSRLNMDLKVISRSNRGHKYILCVIDEVTNYLIRVPIHQSKSEEIGHVIAKYCVPDYIIMDQDSAFMSSLMNYLFKKLDIKIKTVSSTHKDMGHRHLAKTMETTGVNHAPQEW